MLPDRSAATSGCLSSLYEWPFIYRKPSSCFLSSFGMCCTALSAQRCSSFCIGENQRAQICRNFGGSLAKETIWLSLDTANFNQIAGPFQERGELHLPKRLQYGAHSAHFLTMVCHCLINVGLFSTFNYFIFLRLQSFSLSFGLLLHNYYNFLLYHQSSYMILVFSSWKRYT